GLRQPAGYREAAVQIQLYTGIAQTLRVLSPTIFDSSPERLVAAVGDGAGLKFRERHTLRKQARSLWRAAGEPEATGTATGTAAGTAAAPPSREELLAALGDAATQLDRWRELSTDGGPPRLPSGVTELAALLA